MADDDDRKLDEALQVMRDQARFYGIAVDPLWSPEDLAQKIIDAQMAVKAKQDAEFQKAKKVKVLMKRDGFPLEDLRVPAGKTCDVPIELAQRWLAAGVCERADPLPGIE